MEVKALKKALIVSACLQVAVPAFAGGSAVSKAESPPPARAVIPGSSAERYARRCLPRAPNREQWPNGTLLWATKRGWGARPVADERSSVLVSVDLEPSRRAAGSLAGLVLQ